MKTLKYFVWTCLATALAVGCTDDPTYTRGAEDDPNTYGVYFPTQTTPTEVEVSSTDPLEVTYKVARTRYLDAITVPVEVTVSDEGIFEIAPLFFRPGQKETELKVSFPNVRKGKEYTCDIRIVDPHYISLYSPNATSLSMSVVQADWVLVTSEDGTQTKGKWRDDLISNLYATTSAGFNPNPEVDVEIYERDDKPGYYRMKVYNGAFVTAMTGSSNVAYQSRDVYTTIDASDPQKVYIPYQSTGLALLTDDGEVRIASNVSKNFSMDESADQYGTLKDGVITFPTQSIMLEMEKHSGAFYYGNRSGLLRIQLPGVKAPDYTVKLTKHEPENGVVEIDAKFADDVKEMRYALYEGVVDEGQSSLYAQDLDAEKDETGTFDGTVTESGTFKIENLKTGKYTLVGCVYGDEDDEMKSYAFISFGYVAPGEEKEIDLHFDLESTNEFASQGISSDNSVKFYAYGSEIESLTYGLFRTDRIGNLSIESLLDNQGFKLESSEIAELNEGYFCRMFTNLNGDSDYTFALRVNNGYYEKTLTRTCKTTGTFDPGLEFYSYSDYLDNNKQPTVEKLTGTKWNYYAINLMAETTTRNLVGEVTITLNKEESSSSQPILNVKGLSGIDFTSGGDIKAYYIPGSLFGGTYTYNGAFVIQVDGEFSGVYNGQDVLFAFLDTNSQAFVGAGMYFGAVADGYLYCVTAPAAAESGYQANYLFTASMYDLYSLMTEMMLVDPAVDRGSIPGIALKNIEELREKAKAAFYPRNFVELPQYASGRGVQPQLNSHLSLNLAGNSIPATAPMAKRCDQARITVAPDSQQAAADVTFQRIGKKVE